MGSRKPHVLAGVELPTKATAERWIGWRVDDVQGVAIGRVQAVLCSDDGLASWLVIAEFRFGDSARFYVPADEAVAGGKRVWVPFERAFVRETARMGSNPHRQFAGAERRLHEHYGRYGRGAA